MIKIHKQLWYVIAPSREDDLAYMTHYEENEAFEKRKSTGISWAGGSRTTYNYQTRKYEDVVGYVEPTSVVIDNKPVSGIYIGSSVSRWSTSNKLFRVKDPRGFTVEVPTDNIATLLHLTTVTKGVVQEDCVWARDGSSHILLPINSEPYLETLDKMDQVANRLIPFKDLKVGDWFKLFEDSTEYYYVGKVQCTWKIIPWSYGPQNYYHYEQRKKIYKDTFTITEKGYRDLFFRKWSDGDISETRVSKSAKITEVLRNELLDIDDSKLSCDSKYWRDTDSYYADYELVSKVFK